MPYKFYGTDISTICKNTGISRPDLKYNGFPDVFSSPQFAPLVRHLPIILMIGL